MTPWLSLKHKVLISTGCLAVVLQLFYSSQAFGQLDYFSYQKKTGFRVGVGMGLTALRAVYDITPLKPAFVANVDYCFTPYLSVGFEGQKGILKGVDSKSYYYYSESSDNYMSGSINVRAGVGQLFDFFSRNKLMDAVKRTYIGAGVGVLKTDITLQDSNDETRAIYGAAVTQQNVADFSFEVGTYIDLRNILGYDKLEINPKMQFSYLPTRTFDGFISRPESPLRGVYDLFAVSVRYKF